MRVPWSTVFFCSFAIFLCQLKSIKCGEKCICFCVALVGKTQQSHFMPKAKLIVLTFWAWICSLRSVWDWDFWGRWICSRLSCWQHTSQASRTFQLNRPQGCRILSGCQVAAKLVVNSFLARRAIHCVDLHSMIGEGFSNRSRICLVLGPLRKEGVLDWAGDGDCRYLEEHFERTDYQVDEFGHDGLRMHEHNSFRYFFQNAQLLLLGVERCKHSISISCPICLLLCADHCHFLVQMKFAIIF